MVVVEFHRKNLVSLRKDPVVLVLDGASDNA